MELDIVAESSIAEYSTEEYTTAVSCAGVDDAYATVSISGGSANDFNNAICLENQSFYTVTWFLDNGDTEFNEFDTEITEGVFIEEDNLPAITGGDNIPDTFTIDELSPGFYFAQIQDCIAPGCGIIVEFDLRPEPEPITLDMVIDQTDCALNEEASA